MWASSLSGFPTLFWPTVLQCSIYWLQAICQVYWWALFFFHQGSKLFLPHSIQNKDLSPTIICSGCTFTSNPYTFAAIMSKQIQWLSRSLLLIQRPLQVDPATETIDSWGKIHLLVERMQLIMNCKVHLVLRYLLNSQCRCSANVKSLVFEIISVWTHMVKEST